jgi:hypothetical protein
MRPDTVSRALIVAALLASAIPAPAQDVTEPRSGATFPACSGDMALIGTGLRTKTFLKVKVYAIGLYVAEAALSGPLAAHTRARPPPQPSTPSWSAATSPSRSR